VNYFFIYIFKINIMFKKSLGGIALLAIAAVAVMNVNLNSQSNDLSDISLANVEALAGDETSECPNGCYPDGNGCYCHGWHDCEQEAN
jgi:hypothetical protein